MRVFITGDYFPCYRIKEMVDKDDFHFFDEVRPLTQEADLSIVNLEGPIVSSDAKPIPKCGPNLKMSPKVIGSLEYAGFNMVTLANNHILDYGKEGLDETIACFEKANIKYVGVGDNLKEASRIKYFEKDGKTLAIINCCEREFSIAEYDKAGANPLNPISQFHAIQEAKSKADYVLVIVHGGHEHWQLPSPRMVDTYRFFIDLGADAVINHHQHCFSGYELHNGKPIFYGLGNFCFDDLDRNKKWCEGYALSLTFGEKINFSIYPYIQCEKEPIVKFLSKDAFNERIDELNSFICDEEKLIRETENYYASTNRQIRAIVEPYNNRYLKKLFSMGLLPSFFKGKKAKMLENYVICEAHRDKIRHFFKSLKD